MTTETTEEMTTHEMSDDLSVRKTVTVNASRAETMRGIFDSESGWTGLLARFAALANR